MPAKSKKESKTENMKPTKALLQEFIAFIKKYGVLGLAIGVVTGTAVKDLVNSFVTNIINPILGRIVSEGSLTSLEIWGIRYGAFLNEVINFTILMMIMFAFIKFFLSRFVEKEELEKIK
jgi:large conductance mechanosensitive channel